MDIDTIIKDARDPSSKNNTFRVLWADYQAAAYNIEQKRIFGYPLKNLEGNLLLIREAINEIRYGDQNKEKVAEHCLDLVNQCKTTINSLMTL